MATAKHSVARNEVREFPNASQESSPHVCQSGKHDKDSEYSCVMVPARVSWSRSGRMPHSSRTLGADDNAEATLTTGYVEYGESDQGSGLVLPF